MKNGAIGMLVGVALSATVLAGGQSGKSWSVPRMPDGHPDFQGVWANNGMTPLERPKVFGLRATMTDAELADIKKKAQALDHALQIVVELKASLDPTAAPKLCENLAALYDFVTERLVSASVSLTLPPLDQATRVMRELGEAFRAAHAK
jgi:flagellar biosynthetic protein FliS